MKKFAAVVVIVVVAVITYWAWNEFGKEQAAKQPPENNYGQHDPPNENNNVSTPPKEEKESEENSEDNKDEQDQDEIALLLSNMTLEEKLGQMVFAGIAGTTIQESATDLIENNNIGGIILYAHNIENTEQTIQLLNDLKHVNRNHPLPLFFGIDQEGGRVSRLPQEIAAFPAPAQIGALEDEQLSYDSGAILGRAVAALGFNLNFAPVLDVNSNPLNPVIGDRAYSSDVDIVSKLGVQAMKGLQSQQVIPVVKHFPGHGDTSVDSHYDLPVVTKTLSQLRELELLPFQAAIEQGADVVMLAHLMLPELDDTAPSTFSSPIVTGMLREELGFEGVIITDDMTMGAITNYYSIGEAAVRSVQAGSDLILVAHELTNVLAVLDALTKAVEEKRITQERIEESVRRIIVLKQRYELTNEPTDPIDVADLNKEIETISMRMEQEN